MIAHQAEWWTLEQGMYLRDAHAKTWRIVAKRYHDGQHEAVLLGSDGKQSRIALPPDKVVDLMVPTEEEVVALVRRVIPGSIVLAVEEAPSGKNTKVNRLGMTQHLITMHGLGLSPHSDVSNGSLESLTDAHMLASAVPERERIPHAHFPVLRLLDGSLAGLGFSRPVYGAYRTTIIDPQEVAA